MSAYLARPRLRRGKPRKHPEGWALNIFEGDETPWATVYGATPEEAEKRAVIVIGAVRIWMSRGVHSRGFPRAL